VTTHTSPLGSFDYTYLGQTGQVKRQQLAKGFAVDQYYDSNAKDRCLKAIVPWSLVSLPGTDAAVHLYQNQPENLITAHGELPGKSERYTYDAAYRLTKEDSTPWILDWKNWLAQVPSDYSAPLTLLLGKHGLTGVGSKNSTTYTLDAADNITKVTAPDESWSGTVNANNQYTAAKGANWKYDAVGNLIDDGKRTYTWDAAKRLISVKDKSTSQKSEFAYDGLSRMIVRKEYANATATASETRYLWCGDKVCEARDGQDNITSHYYDEGEIQGTTSLFYVKDHLGSVTDVVSAQGKSMGKLDYGPYGEQEKATGKLTDFRYAGMLYHPNSGYYFTHYRVYDPETGRWLSRDPIGEEGGINLYGYVGGNPLRWIDVLGLDPGDLFKSADDAAWDAAMYARKQPIKIKEYGGWVYQQGNCWTYNFIVGKDTAIDVSQLLGIKPSEGNRRIWHTHPPLYGTHEPDIFSPADEAVARREGSMYLYTPQNELKLFDPNSSDFSPQIIPYRKPSPCECQQ
jgi:RHS repeat-associated protein